MEETANKFKLLDGDFLGYFKELGIPYNDVRAPTLSLGDFSLRVSCLRVVADSRMDLVSRHDIARIWVAFFQECQQYRCGQAVAHGRSHSVVTL